MRSSLAEQYGGGSMVVDASGERITHSTTEQLAAFYDSCLENFESEKRPFN